MSDQWSRSIVNFSGSNPLPQFVNRDAVCATNSNGRKLAILDHHVELRSGNPDQLTGLGDAQQQPVCWIDHDSAFHGPNVAGWTYAVKRLSAKKLQQIYQLTRAGLDTGSNSDRCEECWSSLVWPTGGAHPTGYPGPRFQRVLPRRRVKRSIA